ncbi:unnamed protein product [Ixodes pacificus]
MAKRMRPTYRLLFFPLFCHSLPLSISREHRLRHRTPDAPQNLALVPLSDRHSRTVKGGSDTCDSFGPSANLLDLLRENTPAPSVG